MSVIGTKILHHVLSEDAQMESTQPYAAEDAQMESTQPDAATEHMVIKNFIHGYTVILIITDNAN